MKQYALGVDIGGTKCAVVLGAASRADTANLILDKQSFPTQTRLGPEQTLAHLLDTIDCVLRRNRLTEAELAGIGISCGGPLNHSTGVICSPPNLYGWNNVPIVHILHTRYRVPCYLQNDANAGALAEWLFGAARGYSNIVFLTFGTGLGAGLILNGQLYCGAGDMAGEVGHIRLSENGPVGYGKSGSFEGFCSGGGLAQLARVKVLEALQQGDSPSLCPTYAQLDTLDAKTVAQAAMAGDPLAASIYRLCGEYLGRGLAVLMDLLNPEVIVIGSIFQRCQALLWPAAEAVIRREALPQAFQGCQVVPSALGDRIGDYAALSILLSQL